LGVGRIAKTNTERRSGPVVDRKNGRGMGVRYMSGDTVAGKPQEKKIRKDET